MRKGAVLEKPVGEIRRVMIYAAGDGAYLFLFETIDDANASADYWFESESDATAAAEEDYGVAPQSWVSLPDPQPHCQHDWIAPVRVKGRETGQPRFGEMERFDGTRWVDFKRNSK
jgi:biofilm protein TabA